MSGFIAIQRSLWDHPIFADGEMTEREAWIWMLAKAAWKDTRHRVGQSLVDVPRGSFMATLRELQRTFGWRSDTRVRTLLNTLEQEGMIERKAIGQGNAQKTRITICNYNEYQQGERTKRAQKTQTERGKNAVKEQGNKKQSNPNGLRPDGVSDDVWNDFVLHRKRKRADITATAIQRIETEARKAGWGLSDALAEVVARGWTGFKSEWVEKREQPKSDKPAQSPQEWLTYCEEQVRKWRRFGGGGDLDHWEREERAARAALPKLRVVE